MRRIATSYRSLPDCVQVPVQPDEISGRNRRPPAPMAGYFAPFPGLVYRRNGRFERCFQLGVVRAIGLA